MIVVLLSFETEIWTLRLSFNSLGVFLGFFIDTYSWGERTLTVCSTMFDRI